MSSDGEPKAGVLGMLVAADKAGSCTLLKLPPTVVVCRSTAGRLARCNELTERATETPAAIKGLRCVKSECEAPEAVVADIFIAFLVSCDERLGSRNMARER